MGIPGVTLPPDPIQLQPTYGAGAGRLRETRSRSGSSSTAAPAASRRASPTPASRSPSTQFPVPGTEAKAWYLVAGRRPRAPAPPAGPHADGFTWDADALPTTDFSGDTAAGEGGLWTATARIRLGPEPAGQRRLLPDRAAGREHDRDRRRRRQRSGSAPRPPTSTCRRRSARSGPTARRPSSRTAGCGATSASSTPPRAPPLEPVLSLREVRRLAAARRTSSCQVTIPLYYEGHAYRAGSRIRVTIAAPNGTQPIWAFDQTEPEGTAQVAIAYGDEHALAPPAPGRARGRACRPACRPARACAGSPAATTRRSRTCRPRRRRQFDPAIRQFCRCSPAAPGSGSFQQAIAARWARIEGATRWTCS